MLAGTLRELAARRGYKAFCAALRSVAVCCLQWGTALPLHAQMAPLPDVPAPPPANSATSFELFASDEESNDSNLFRIPSGFDLGAVLGTDAAPSDHWNSLNTGVVGQWALGQQLLLYSGEVDVERFARNAFLDNTSGNAKLTWDWSVGSLLTGNAGVDAEKALAGFTNTRSFVKDLVDDLKYFGNARWQVGPRLSLFAGVLEQKLTNSSDVRLGDDFRLTAEDAGSRVAFGVTDSVGWEYQHVSGRFPDDIEFLNNVPAARDFEDNSGRLLVTYGVAGVTTIDASAGYLKRDYLNDSIGNFSGDVWRASLRWQPLAKSELTLAAWRDLYAYLQAQSDYFISTGESVSPSWKPTDKLQLNLSFSWEKQNYIESSGPGAPLFSSREDHVSATQIKLTYNPVRSVAVNLSYRSETRVSNVSAFSYDDRIASAKVTVRFGEPAR